jgi:hypothetical protein
LKSWYQILSAPSATSMGVFTYSVAGDAAYHGKGRGSGGYNGRPCVEVMRINGNRLILESTATAWQVGDSVELAISPYPDVKRGQSG